jgi:hypothetical protein
VRTKLGITVALEASEFLSTLMTSKNYDCIKYLPRASSDFVFKTMIKGLYDTFEFKFNFEDQSKKKYAFYFKGIISNKANIELNSETLSGEAVNNFKGKMSITLDGKTTEELVFFAVSFK